MIKIWLLGRFI